MDDEAEIGAFEEVVDALLEARWEIRALRQLLIDRKVFSEEEITAEIENIKNEEYVNLKKKVLRQAFERSLKKRLTQ
jgi:TATA-binding protein-associated factor Taf7